MLELVQFPWSPFCLVQRRILGYAGVPFRTVNIPAGDRSLVWRLTRGRYYEVPVLKDGRSVIFEVEGESQVIAKYLDDKLKLGLFPRQWEGVQDILWQHIEDQLEELGFKLNDSYAREFVPTSDWLRYLRHKERKFGRGCLDQWREHRLELLSQLAERLVPFERMLATRPFLLDDQPRFVDFDLFGILANFLFSGHYELPLPHTRLKLWYGRLAKLKFAKTRT